MRRFLAAHWREIASDALLIGGLASASAGAAMVYAPAGFVVAGAGAVWLGLLLGKD